MDGNNYEITQTSLAYWLVFLVIVTILVFAMVCWFLIEVNKACQVTSADVKHRHDHPEPVGGVLGGDVAQHGDERVLADAGAGPGGTGG